MLRMISFAIVLLVITSLSLSAQMFRHGIKDPILRNKLDEYHKINVCPQWTLWVNKIESAMSSEDLEKLNTLRSETRILIKEKHENLANGNTDNESKNGKGKKHGRKNGKRNGFDEIRKNSSEQLRIILSDYDVLIKQILDEAKPFHEKWRADIKTITTEHFDNEEKNPNRRDKGNRRFKNDNGKHFIGMLLMWDKSCDNNDTEFMKSNVKDIEVRTYPNPTNDNVKIVFNLLEKTYIKLSISNASGENIAQLYDGWLNAGEHTYDFNAAKLTPGAYIYKLESNGTIKTGKIILSK